MHYAFYTSSDEFSLQCLDAGMELACIDSGLDEQVLSARELLARLGV